VKQPKIIGLALTTLCSAFAAAPCAWSEDKVDPSITVRDGYALTIAIEDIREPRFMEFGPDGTLYVSIMEAGEIKACRDTDGDGDYDAITSFIKAGETTHALQWHDGWLWYTESGVIAKARDTDGDFVSDETVTILEGEILPSGGGHWFRSILIHDGRIYTSMGDAENASDERHTKRQKLWSYKLDGSDEKLFCTGLRNTEKLVLRPGTGEIWGMDHGSDWFGGIMEQEMAGMEDGQPITDVNPPGEMNHYVGGAFYGHPFITGSGIPRYEYMRRDDIVKLAAQTTLPAWPTGAHWAPNAMEFYTGDAFPGAKGDAFVAYHGSWNSSVPVGSCLSRVLFDNGRPYGELVYVDFKGADGSVLASPVDTVMDKDGSLLISSDRTDTIYRLRYTGE
jgi:glucose/arabinose dehydrogenase